ncbi:hypothetical protein [Trichormus azollae]|uniref:hypothetical protein n=1 Tax=Trichormus azollae TaxID=1164 RepID=UPI000195752F|nr:hypothetical protein [Trichormus azollae]
MVAGTEVISDGVSYPQLRHIHQWCESREEIKDEKTAVSQLQRLVKDSIQK